MKFGKLPARKDPRTLKFGDYLKSTLAAPPPGYSSLSHVLAKLPGDTISDLFPMDGNDVLGDCTIAALAHAMTVYRGLIGEKDVMPSSVVQDLYFQLTGGQDIGLTVLDVLNYWRQNPVNGERILAYVSVDPLNHEHVQQAIRLFGGVYIGLQVSIDLLEQFNHGSVWTVAPLTPDGHAVFTTGYDQKHMTMLTWADTQEGTWGWWDESVDEAYAILPVEAQTAGFAKGFDFAHLQADLRLVTS
jgi:hypothetical protein